MTVLQPRQSIPHFEVTLVDGAPFQYRSIWQRKNLLLVAVPARETQAAGQYIARVTDRMGEIAGQDAECVITRGVVPGVPPPAVVVADRWGEVHFAAKSDSVEGLPSPEELIEWLEYLQVKCPECEGESR